MLNRRDFLRYSISAAGTVWLSTAVSGCGTAPRRGDLTDVRFDHGVASGDPQSDAVLLWTRAQPVGDAGSVSFAWEVAADPEFTRVLRRGVVTSDASRDFTVKIDVRELDAGRDYFYRFLGAASESVVGRSRTLPTGALEQLRLGVFSCSNYPAGFFHPYREASRLEAVDAFLHLGDYIYEYGSGGYATERAAELDRQLALGNRGELFTLADYRRRYALYRSDPDLQAVHAAAPMIVVWDDHEIANDSWQFGAQNHGEDEGDFEARKLAAIQAYFEWLPLRPIIPDADGTIYRSFDFGDLVSLHMLDTRLIGRDQQLEYRDFVNDAGSLDLQRMLPQLRDPQRSLLGSAQRDWLQQRFRQSAGHWQVLGQQVLMARMEMPAEMLRGLFGDARGDTVAMVDELARLKLALLSGEAPGKQQLARLRAVLPYNLDAWDGYPAERERVYSAARDAGRPLVVLAGDTHNAWYSRLHDADGRFMGVELGTSSVSSPGMESYLGLDDASAQQLALALPVLIEDLQWCELQRRGFLEVVFTRDAVESRWHFVDSVVTPDYRSYTHRERISA